MAWLSESGRPARRELMRLLSRCAVVVAAFLIVLSIAAGCGAEDPPDITVGALGAAVGNAKLDDTDFAALLSSFATETYTDTAEPEQGNFQLYLAAKAADLGLNKPGSDALEVRKEISGDSAIFSFVFERKEGLFAVADVSVVEIHLERTDAESYPWRISAIQLLR